jgi:glycosyltransferase involved in cell wall biosynthesis
MAMVAAFRPQKDQQTLIRAMALLPPDFQLYLAGGYETESDKARFDDCRCLAKELGMEDRVHFLGIRDDVPALYAAADVLVLSSHHEGMPLSVLEGMASGKPFVASDVQGLREVVGGAGVLVPESDAESLANAIRHIVDHPEKARLIAMNCKKRAQEYDIAQTVRLYNSMYQTA